jgi:hypothetical protein
MRLYKKKQYDPLTMYDQMKEDAMCQPPDAATTQRTHFSKSLKYNKRRERGKGDRVKSTTGLSHRDTRPVGKHPSGNVHRGQLLEQKLGGIGDVYLRDAMLVVAETALE